ncbi:hypothetical protein EXN66_Car008954 [Channa argus]|uniref:Uncharacterized protein n=1 Tax=Channa argus TaxID=215402 RepID=A0A6G1PTG1_CHAAH|nr:hypothetical protein EXN66_Car008954 [Channa argus]
MLVNLRTLDKLHVQDPRHAARSNYEVNILMLLHVAGTEVDDISQNTGDEGKRSEKDGEGNKALAILRDPRRPRHSLFRNGLKP